MSEDLFGKVMALLLSFLLLAMYNFELKQLSSVKKLDMLYSSSVS